jgi:hypothetical protein
LQHNLPESRHSSARATCLLRAEVGDARPSKKHPPSFTFERRRTFRPARTVIKAVPTMARSGKRLGVWGQAVCRGNH